MSFVRARVGARSAGGEEGDYVVVRLAAGGRFAVLKVIDFPNDRVLVRAVAEAGSEEGAIAAARLLSGAA